MYITAYSKQCKEFCYGSPGSLFFIGSRFLYTWGGRFAFCYLYRKKRQDISAGSFDFASFPEAHPYRFFIVALVLSVIFPTLSYPLSEYCRIYPIFCLLSLPALYFMVHLFHSFRKVFAGVDQNFPLLAYDFPNRGKEEDIRKYDPGLFDIFPPVKALPLS